MAYEPIFFDIETTGLNPMAQQWWDSEQFGAQVTAVGFGTIDDWRGSSGHDDAEYTVDIHYDSSEYRLLQVVHERLADKAKRILEAGDKPFLVSFNGRKFDHPYLGARYARLRLDGKLFNQTLKRLDMMRALGKHYDGCTRYPSEDDCLEAVGIESEDKYDGSDMPQAFADKNWGIIRDHVESDVEEMMRLFVELQEECLTEFYDHYDIDSDPNSAEEVEY